MYCEEDGLFVVDIYFNGEYCRVGGDYEVWSVCDGDGVFFCNGSDVCDCFWNMGCFN